MVEELAVLGGPSDLHHPRRDDGHLVVPNPRVHAERASHALERGGVAAGLRGPAGGGGKSVRSEAGRRRHPPALPLTSRPVGEILRYSLTSLLFSMALTLARLTFSYVNWRPSFRTARRRRKSGQRRRRGANRGAAAPPLLTQIVQTPLGAEAHLPPQVVGMLRPQLQGSQAAADAGLGHRQLVLACWGQVPELVSGGKKRPNTSENKQTV